MPHELQGLSHELGQLYVLVMHLMRVRPDCWVPRCVTDAWGPGVGRLAVLHFPIAAFLRACSSCVAEDWVRDANSAAGFASGRLLHCGIRAAGSAAVGVPCGAAVWQVRPGPGLVVAPAAEQASES